MEHRAVLRLRHDGRCAHHGAPDPPGFRSQLFALFELSAVHGEFWQRLADVVKPFGWPQAVGTMPGGVAMAGAAYPLALAFVTSRQRIRDMIGGQHWCMAEWQN